MKLAVFCDAFVPAGLEGGPPFSTANLCRGLAAAGADVHVVTTDRNGSDRLDVPADRWIDHDGVRVWFARSLPGPYYFAPSARRAAASLADVDGLISSGTLWSHLGVVARRAARRADRPGLVLPRGLLAPWALARHPVRKRLYWWLAGRRLLRDAAAVVALCEHERQTIESLGVARRVEAIPNGVWIDDFAGPVARSVVDEWLPALRGHRFVLFLGRIRGRKGVRALVDALREPALAHADFRLVIAGPVDEAFRAEWDPVVSAGDARLVLPGRVAGHRKAALFAHASAFVLPSHGEGLPVAVLEALASGCPVILTSRCHLPEVATAGAGVEIEAVPSQIATAIARLLADEPLRREMGRRALTLARGTFDARLIGQRVLALCRDVARARPTSAARAAPPPRP